MSILFDSKYSEALSNETSNSVTSTTVDTLAGGALDNPALLEKLTSGTYVHSVCNWVTDRVLKLVWVTIFSKILTSDGHYSCIIFLANRTIIGHYFFYQTQFYDWDSSQKQGLGKFSWFQCKKLSQNEGLSIKKVSFKCTLCKVSKYNKLRA